MTEETNVAVASQQPAEPVQPPQPISQPPKGKKRKKGHPVRTAIIVLAVVAALGVGGFFLWRFLSTQEDVNSTMQTATAEWKSIQSSVQGTGSARAKESAAVSIQNAGIVQTLYVSEGQMVNQGDPLFEIVSPAAQQALDTALDKVTNRQEAVQKAYDALADLQQDLADCQKEYDKLLEDQRQSNIDRFVRAPFSGQLQETHRYQVDQHLASDVTIAKLVDDSKFRIPFYFSYAYQGQIQAGQQVDVTVGGSSAQLSGKVEEVNMVRRVSPEGTLLFEVVVVVDNPGAFTSGLSATASIPAGGDVLYPYDAGKLEYYRTMDLTTKTEGDVVSTALRDYTDVKAGDVVLTLSEEDYSQRLEDKTLQISAKQEEIKAQEENIATAQESVDEAQKEVDEAQKALEDLSAVAPISGTITSCALVEGQEVTSSEASTVITISNNATMVVTISVDDRNIAYVKPGMGVDLQSNWGDGGTFYGVVTKIDMSLSGDAMGSGMTNYPVTLEVDNMDGSLLEGMWLSYSFVTSQSDNCIVVPMQAVRYMSLEDGETASVIFIQADSRPENTVDIDIPEPMPGEAPQYPSESDGFYPVPVETGLSDNYNIEITSGLQGGETIFVNYYLDQASSWG